MVDAAVLRKWEYEVTQHLLRTTWAFCLKNRENWCRRKGGGVSNVRAENHFKFCRVTAIAVLLYGFKSWTLTEEQMRRMETDGRNACPESDRRTQNERNEDVRGELGITDVSTTVTYPIKINDKDTSKDCLKTEPRKAEDTKDVRGVGGGGKKSE